MYTMWEENLVCDSIRTAPTFTTEACQETFKVQSSLLTCHSEKSSLSIKMQSLW